MLKTGITIICLSILIAFHSCEDDFFFQNIPNQITFEETLSQYTIFKGPIKNLEPAENVLKYELNTALFTDYASKSRFIKLPEGSSMSVKDDFNLDFPEGTILVKNFFYPVALLPDENSNRILETRLLILHNGKWNVGVYKWNDAQTEAFLIEHGSNEEMSISLLNGNSKRFTYRIPSNTECTTCHNMNGRSIPLGPKISNINRLVDRNGLVLNQIEHWIEEGFLKDYTPNSISPLPEWNNTSVSLNDRARAYLDLNCAHCHNPSGMAANWSLDLRFSTSFTQTGIEQLRYHIPERMSSNWSDERMPKIGNSLKHDEGIQLIRQYVENL